MCIPYCRRGFHLLIKRQGNCTGVWQRSSAFIAECRWIFSFRIDAFELLGRRIRHRTHVDRRNRHRDGARLPLRRLRCARFDRKLCGGRQPDGPRYGLAFFIRDEYGIESLLEGRRSPGRLFLVWNLAFVGIAVIGFLTKSTQLFSRAWLVLFYISGFATADHAQRGAQSRDEPADCITPITIRASGVRRGSAGSTEPCRPITLRGARGKRTTITWSGTGGITAVTVAATGD